MVYQPEDQVTLPGTNRARRGLTYHYATPRGICVCVQDLLRTMPGNACFCNINSTGIPRLRRVLRAIAWLYPDIGYCQGTGMVSTLREIDLTFMHDILLNTFLATLL